MAEEVCPECQAGKHLNCTGWAISEEDQVTDCKCRDPGHPWVKK